MSETADTAGRCCKHEWNDVRPVHTFCDGVRDGFSTRTYHVTWCTACNVLGVKQKVSNRRSRVLLIQPDTPLRDVAEAERICCAQLDAAIHSPYAVV